VKKEVGPIYGVELLDSLPLDGGMSQALPSRKDLDDVRRTKINGNDRVVAGYEVLLEHYRRLLSEHEDLLQCAAMKDALVERLVWRNIGISGGYVLDGVNYNELATFLVESVKAAKAAKEER